ncbi:glycerophosphodiester phosphodiesterase family protein [Calditrichota bacterium LG25]
MEVESKQTTLIIAHRGASYAAPENTLPAFKMAFAEKADFIEGDFWMTKDKQIVCIHDPNTARVTNQKFNLDVRRSTLPQLKRLDVGSWKGQQFKGATIPTLQEVLDMLPADKGLFVELKDTRPAFLERLKEIFTQYGMEPQRLRLIAFDPDLVKMTRKVFPEFKIYWLYNWYKVKETGNFSNTPHEILRMLEQLPCDGLNINPFPWIDLSFVRNLRLLNMDFCVYNVNSFDELLKLLTLGVDAIATDHPAKLRQQLEKYFNPLPLSRAQNEELKVKENGDYTFRNHPIGD